LALINARGREICQKKYEEKWIMCWDLPGFGHIQDLEVLDK
jgi:hypothetical protein